MPEGKKEHKLVGGWAKPSEKICSSIGGFFPNFQGENSKKYLKQPPLRFLLNIPKLLPPSAARPKIRLSSGRYDLNLALVVHPEFLTGRSAKGWGINPIQVHLTDGVTKKSQVAEKNDHIIGKWRGKWNMSRFLFSDQMSFSDPQICYYATKPPGKDLREIVVKICIFLWSFPSQKTGGVRKFQQEPQISQKSKNEGFSAQTGS